MKWKESFFNAMKSQMFDIEKKAFISFGNALVGAITAADIAGQLKETKNKAQIGAPMRQNPAASQFKLQSPYKYQFEGGKHTGLKSTMPEQFPLYS